MGLASPSTPPQAASPPKRQGGDLRLFVVAVLCGAFFFASLSKLWPLVPGNLYVPPKQLTQTASMFLRGRGISVDGYQSSTSFQVDEGTLDDLERRFGPQQTRQILRSGVPVAYYDVSYKQPGNPNLISVQLDANGQRVTGWLATLQEDDAGARLTVEQARTIARNTIAEALGLVPSDWTETGVSTRDALARRNHVFTFEKQTPITPTNAIKERMFVTISGDRPTAARRTLVIPPASARTTRMAGAARQTLNLCGLALLSGAMLGAIAVFLLRLRDGSARLRRAAIWSGGVFACTMGAVLLQTSRSFNEWDPLWPRWVSLLQFLVEQAQDEIWTLLVLVALVASGDVLDRERGGQKGESLWRLTQGKLTDPLVGKAAGRGFLIGLICGGVMAFAVLCLAQFAHARVAFQPRAFFFYALNSPAPGLSTLLYFLHVALLEELGYRYFSGLWLDKVTRKRWLAIVAPAVVYGLTHTTLGFLPPAEPFWARAFVMTLIGGVWGWAFFRYDALTVVISHLTADLFILNWPRLASGDPMIVASAVLTIVTPLLPFITSLPRLLRRSEPGLEEP